MRPLALLAVLLLASVASAQSERYELAARLKAFEAEWDKQTDKDARKRALKDLPQVTQQFFSFQFGNAGKTLDDARFALLSDKPQSDAVLWATSLYPEVKLRLTSEKEVPVTVKQFYSVKAERPKGVSIRAGFDGKTWTTAEIDKLPVKLSVPVPKSKQPVQIEDLVLTVEVVVEGKPLASRSVGVSAIDGLMLADLPNVKGLVPDLGKPENLAPLESATFNDHIALLKDLAGGTIPESDIQAAKLWASAIEMVLMKNKGKDHFISDYAGDHRISIPTDEKGKTVTPCRLFVPEKLDAKKPVPLVVAMHGAGGSENMFFETYGAGRIGKLCKERGWLLMSPRAGFGFGLSPGPPVGEIIDELANRYPIDAKRVFIVGHSMGSGMAFEAVQKYPGKFAAVAGLGGGGKVRDEKVFAELPVFLGVGDKDFAVRTAKGLQAALEKAKAAKVTFKEYPDVEHLVIVREAVGDVFDLFDKVK
jgi:predicted esterase